MNYKKQINIKPFPNHIHAAEGLETADPLLQA